jgi:hypothetical protein
LEQLKSPWMALLVVPSIHPSIHPNFGDSFCTQAQWRHNSFDCGKYRRETTFSDSIESSCQLPRGMRDACCRNYVHSILLWGQHVPKRQKKKQFVRFLVDSWM